MLQRQTDPKTIYQRLARLRIGVTIPVDLYIAERADGGVPRWVVINRRVLPRGGVQLLVEDQSPEQLQLSAATNSRMLPRMGIEAFPERIRGTRVYAGERGWPRSYPDDLTSLARRANEREQARTQPRTHQSVSFQPASPWYKASVAEERALPAGVLAALPANHGFHQGTVIVVRRWGPHQWAAWDRGGAALLVSESIARRALKTRKDEHGHPLLAENQRGCEEGFRQARGQRAVP